MKKLVMILVITGMLISAGCSKKSESLEEIKARVQAVYDIESPKETAARVKQLNEARLRAEYSQPEEAEPNAEIVAAFLRACKEAAAYRIAWEDYRSREDLKNYYKWKREARRLAILLGY